MLIPNLQPLCVFFFFKNSRMSSLIWLIMLLALQAHVFTSQPGVCAAFLANYNTNSIARVMFNNVHYNLPPWSISILPDCRNVVFNTAKVRRTLVVFKSPIYIHVPAKSALPYVTLEIQFVTKLCLSCKYFLVVFIFIVGWYSNFPNANVGS